MDQKTPLVPFLTISVTSVLLSVCSTSREAELRREHTVPELQPQHRDCSSSARARSVSSEPNVTLRNPRELPQSLLPPPQLPTEASKTSDRATLRCYRFPGAWRDTSSHMVSNEVFQFLSPLTENSKGKSIHISQWGQR